MVLQVALMWSQQSYQTAGLDVAILQAHPILTHSLLALQAAQLPSLNVAQRRARFSQQHASSHAREANIKALQS